MIDYNEQFPRSDFNLEDWDFDVSPEGNTLDEFLSSLRTQLEYEMGVVKKFSTLAPGSPLYFNTDTVFPESERAETGVRFKIEFFAVKSEKEKQDYREEQERSRLREEALKNLTPEQRRALGFYY